MAVEETFPNPLDMATLDQVKQYLQLDPSDNDADELLARLITAASSFIQSILNRQFSVAQYTDRNNGNGVPTMLVSNYPITAVSSVKVDGREIPAAPDDCAPGFIFDDLAIYLRGYTFTRGVQNVVIGYSGGFATIPPVVTDCVIELVGKKFKYRDRIGHLSRILAGETITYEKSDLTDDMKSMLRNYQKVVPV